MSGNWHRNSSITSWGVKEKPFRDNTVIGVFSLGLMIHLSNIARPFAHLMAPLLNPVAITLTEIPSGAAENSRQLIMCSQVTWPINLPFTVHNFITLPSSTVLSSEMPLTETQSHRTIRTLLITWSRNALGCRETFNEKDFRGDDHGQVMLPKERGQGEGEGNDRGIQHCYVI